MGYEICDLKFEITPAMEQKLAEFILQVIGSEFAGANRSGFEPRTHSS